MQFSQQVTFERSDPDRHPITPEQYASLDDKERRFYEPQYLKYRAKKQRAYDTCYECGHTRFTGWEEVRVPVGDPYRYVPSAPLTVAMADRLLASNVLTARILGKQLYGEGEVMEAGHNGGGK